MSNDDLNWITDLFSDAAAEQLYAEMMRAVGFRSVECRAIRKRNSKKELIEFDVTGIWRG